MKKQGGPVVQLQQPPNIIVGTQVSYTISRTVGDAGSSHASLSGRGSKEDVVQHIRAKDSA